jgi:4-amino-4-deoxy-L-arabinose transferase-like glycosyltransferase
VNLVREAWLPLTLALIVRVVMVLIRGISLNEFPDGVDYVHIATTLQSEGRYPEVHYFARPPLYPLLLTPWAIWGPEAVVIGAKLINIVFGVVATGLAFLLFRPRGLRPAVWAALSVALHPTLVFYSSWVATEGVYATLLLGAILAILRLTSSPPPSAKKAFWAGVLLGLCVLTRPQALALVPPLLIVIGLWLMPTHRWSQRLTVLLTIAGACALTIVPWTARNFLKHGEFILVSDGGGLMFWIANSDYGYRYQQIRSPQEYRALEQELWQEIPNQIGAHPELGPAGRDRFFWRAGWSWIQSRPGEFIEATVHRLGHFIAPWVSPYAYSARTSVLSAFWFAPLFILGLIGLVPEVRQTEPRALIVLCIIVVTFGTVGALFHSVQRYRIPNVDLFFGMFGAAWLADRWRLR